MEKENYTLYNRENQLKRLLEQLPERVGDDNFRAIDRFMELYTAQNALSIGRRLRILQGLVHVCKLMKNKPLVSFTEDDLVELAKSEQLSGYLDMAGTRSVLKQFYRTINEKKYLPLLRSRLLSKKGLQNGRKFVDPEKFWTEEEQKKYLRNAAFDSAEMACFGALLFTSGCRIGELGTLQRKNVEFTPNGLVIHVMGKTGARPIKIHAGVLSFVEKHLATMQNQSSEAFLFGDHDHIKPLTYQGLMKRHKVILERADVSKEKYHNFHGHRKQHATWAYKNLGERMAEQRLGHAIGSKVAKHYSGLTALDANERYDEVMGIAKPNPLKSKAPLEPQPCPLCNKTYPSTQEFCSTCCFPLGAERKVVLMESIDRLVLELYNQRYAKIVENAQKTVEVKP